MNGLLADGGRRLAVAARRLGLRLAPEPRPLDRGAALRALSADARVLVLCHGNICRSPMAERYLRERLCERGIDGLAVDSAGFVDAEGRPSPDLALAVARDYGVDLSGHRSKRVTRELLDASDVVFLMDALNYHHLRTRFGDRPTDAYFLKPFATEAGSRFEISDPHGEGRDAFSRAYGEIARSVDELVDRLCT